MRYLVVERFVRGAEAVYRHAAEHGRMLPDGLHYIDSWIVDDGVYDRCFQLMETDDPASLDEWARRWAGLGELEVLPVIDSTETARRLGLEWGGGDGPG